MSKITRQEVLAKQRDRYARAGTEHKGKIIDELVGLFGYHPKAAIRALRPRGVPAAPFVRGLPSPHISHPLPRGRFFAGKSLWLTAGR